MHPYLCFCFSNAIMSRVVKANIWASGIKSHHLRYEFSDIQGLIIRRGGSYYRVVPRKSLVVVNCGSSLPQYCLTQ